MGTWLRRLVYLLRQSRHDAELRDEIEAHRSLRQAHLEREGLSLSEANGASQRALGNVLLAREDVREIWLGGDHVGILRDLGHDVRLALRGFRRAPGFACATILILGLAIGANTAVFSLVHAVTLRPLPYAQPDSLVALSELNIRSGEPVSIAYPNFEDWRTQSKTLVDMAGYVGTIFNVSTAGAPERIVATQVTPGFLRTLGVTPVLGRDFVSDDGKGNGARVVLLTDGFWRRRFASDRQVIGQSLRMGFEPYTIVGVLPASFRFLPGTELLVPLGAGDGDRGSHNGMHAVARLAADATIESARTELQAIARRLETAFPGSNTGLGVRVQRLDESFAQGRRQIAVMLLVAVLLVLLIACANLANLFVARGVSRMRDLQTRVALGASRWRIVRQLLVESLLLASLGAAFGLALAFMAVPLLTPVVPDTLREIAAVEINTQVLLFMAFVTVTASMLFGLSPIVSRRARQDENVLQHATRGADASATSIRTRQLLLVSEVALAVVLLVGAGLVLKSLWHLQNVDAGFRGAGVLRMQVNFPVGKYRERGRLVPFFERAMAEVRALPEVRSVGAVACPPLGGPCWEAIFAVEGQTVERSQAPTARFNAVAGDYFGVMGIRLLRGRTFTEADYASAAPLVIVNSNLARRFWPESDPVGRRIKIGWPSTGPGSWLEVVGVIQDTKRDTLAEPAQMEAFLMHTNTPRTFMELVVRTEVPPLTLARRVQSAVWQADRDALIYDVGIMDDVRTASLAPVRVPAFIVGAFAILALILATAGVYSLVAFATTQRLGEIAIRLVLGATGHELLLMICRQALMPVAVGLAVGAAGALAFGRVLSGVLFDVRATDGLIYASVFGMVAIVAFTAALIPAARALRVEPSSVLRTQ